MPMHVRDSASSWHGHRFLMGQELSRQEESYLGRFASDYALVRAWSRDCRFPSSTGLAWSSMIRVAGDLNPGLDATTAAAWWRSIAEGKCQGALSPVQKAWLDLFIAVGERKPQGMYGPAEWILQNDSELGPEGRVYATLAAVSADLSMDRRTEAAAVLGEQRARLPAEQLETAPFRYLTMALIAKKRQPSP
jgi:hypothetical protein